MSSTFNKTTQTWPSASYASGTPRTAVATQPSTRLLPCVKYSLFSLYEKSGKDHSASKIVSGSELAYHESSYKEISNNIIQLS